MARDGAMLRMVMMITRKRSMVLTIFTNRRHLKTSKKSSASRGNPSTTNTKNVKLDLEKAYKKIF